MTKRTRHVLIVILASVIVITDLNLIRGNIFAFAWHLQHGFHIQSHGFRFHVPLFFQQSQEGAPDELTMYSFRSAVHRKNSWITIGFPYRSPDGVLTPMPLDDARRLGVNFIGQRNVTTADQQGNCVEYQREEPVLVRYEPSDRDIVWITCRFGAATANFDGTRNAIPEFYDILESVRKVPN